LQNPTLLKQDNTADWDKLIKEFPFCNVIQYLNHSQKESNETSQLSHTAMYKNDSLLFASFFKGKTCIENNRQPFIEDKKIEKAQLVDIDTTEIEVLLSKLNEPVLEAIHHEIKIEPNQIPHATEYDNKHAQEFLTNNETQISDATDLLDEDKSLMVMMSFTEWLIHFKSKTQREKDEQNSQKALKTAWQKEKLTAAVEEEGDEIPELIFKQAMDSISNESEIISEALAGILAKQGKTDRAIEMYKKLSLRNPEKSIYFAHLIDTLNQ
jgi:hypothetical protein